MPLRNHQYVALYVFIHHIPRGFIAVFQATDAQTFTLTQCVVHQTLMLTNHLAVNGFNHTGLCRQITGQEFTEFTLTDKADTGTVFFLCGRQS